MRIQSGLFDNMVLQRNRRGVCAAQFEGTCAATGDVRATVLRAGRAMKGFRDAPLGVAARGRFKGCLRGLPTGGPYDVELRAGDECARARNVLVGDVWILGGQSNMEGIGFLKERAKPDPLVRAFFMDDVWRTAKDPIHNLSEAVDRVHTDLAGGVAPQRAPHVGVGPGVAFGLEMLRLTGIPQGLIPCAHGGTSMEQWSPARKHEGGGSLYGAMLRRLRKNGGAVAGAVWYQGCSDASPESAPLYEDRMRRLIAALRRDGRSPRLPFALAQISRVTGTAWDPAAWSAIRESQRLLAERVPACATVSTMDLEMNDGIHIRGRDQNRLGQRLAQAMRALRGGRQAGVWPIRLAGIRCEADRVTGMADVTVTFDRVVGGLRAAGPASGFEILEGNRPTQAIFRTDTKGRTAVLKTVLVMGQANRMRVAYGYGTAPYCNLRDAADRAVPAFGPLPIERPMAVTPFVRRLRVSAALPSAGHLDALQRLPAARLAPREFGSDFCDLHLDLFAGREDRLVLLACSARCQEPMRLKLCLGYDGPVKVWIDGVPRFHDPAGTNPATPDAAAIRFAAAAGKHEIVVALGSNGGRAWGIFLRVQRTDVPARLLRKGPSAYRMPVIA